jgi:hypothetical protein
MHLAFYAVERQMNLLVKVEVPGVNGQGKVFILSKSFVKA